MKTLLSLLILVLASLGPLLPSSAQDPATVARTILEQSAVKGGFVVHVGAGDGRLTAALRGSESYLVQGVVRHAGRVKASREAVHAAGSYGLVSVDAWNGTNLPYVEGTVNLLVIDEGESVTDPEHDRLMAKAEAEGIGPNWIDSGA